MAARTTTLHQYPPELSKHQNDTILSNIQNWSIQHGLAVRPATSFIPKELDPSGSLAVTAPVTLFPSFFPSKCFKNAKSVQVAFNELYARIAADEQWLGTVVEE